MLAVACWKCGGESWGFVGTCRACRVAAEQERQHQETLRRQEQLAEEARRHAEHLAKEQQRSQRRLEELLEEQAWAMRRKETVALLEEFVASYPPDERDLARAAYGPAVLTAEIDPVNVEPERGFWYAIDVVGVGIVLLGLVGMMLKWLGAGL